MKLQVETYQKRLPSSGTQVTFRPILVKEEKIYIMANESDKPEEFLKGLIQITDNCIIQPENFKIGPMSYNDFIYLFLELRKVSKGENVIMDVFCSNCTDDVEEDGKIKKIPHVERNRKYDLNKIIIIENDNIKRPKIVKFEGYDIGVELLPTTVSFIQQISSDEFKKNSSAALLKYMNISHHLTTILKGEERIDVSNNKQEKEEFIDSLKEDQIEEITKWIALEPRCVLSFDWECPKCQTKNTVRSIDLLRFLEW